MQHVKRPKKLSDSPKLNQSRTYRDLNLKAVLHPATGDIRPVKDERAIMGAVKNIVLTRRGESPHNPTFGTNIDDLLFNFNDRVSQRLFAVDVSDSIEYWEPRVYVRDVQFGDLGDPYAIEMSIFLSFVSEPEEQRELTLFVERIR